MSSWNDQQSKLKADRSYSEDRTYVQSITGSLAGLFISTLDHEENPQPLPEPRTAQQQCD